MLRASDGRSTTAKGIATRSVRRISAYTNGLGSNLW